MILDNFLGYFFRVGVGSGTKIAEMILKTLFQDLCSTGRNEAPFSRMPRNSAFLQNQNIECKGAGEG